MMLTKEQLWQIRREVDRRYRSVELTVKRGEDAPKAYGTWAKPTILKLLETCFVLYARNEALEKKEGEHGTQSQIASS
jgi:hypothetical protein